jgi:hypothetical protein
MPDTLFLLVAAFFSGFIDSIAGGGALIQVPALLITFPAASVATLFGTNKLASFCGTSTAARQYAQAIGIDWQATLPAAISAFVFSFLGATAVSLIRTDVMRPVVLALLVAIAAYTFTRKEFGSLHAPRLSASGQRRWAILTGVVLGFYDGFFGPGTGSFLMFVFIGVFGFNFLSASASAKFVNFSTNLAAILYFAATDNILYRFALPMAACNMLGSFLGSRLAVLKGSRFVRMFFLVVVTGMIARLAWDVFQVSRYVR